MSPIDVNTYLQCGVQNGTMVTNAIAAATTFTSTPSFDIGLWHETRFGQTWKQGVRTAGIAGDCKKYADWSGDEAKVGGTTSDDVITLKSWDRYLSWTDHPINPYDHSFKVNNVCGNYTLIMSATAQDSKNGIAFHIAHNETGDGLGLCAWRGVTVADEFLCDEKGQVKGNKTTCVPQGAELIEERACSTGSFLHGHDYTGYANCFVSGVSC
jgi:hypothetical protein